LYANQPGGESGTGCLVKVFDKKRVLFMVWRLAPTWKSAIILVDS
jgi:hypothetical protein